MKKRYSMRYKILYLCLSSVLIALLVQTALFQNTSTKTIYEQSKETNLHSLNNMQGDINDLIKIVESNLLGIYDEKDLMSDLQSHSPIHKMRENHYRAAHSMAQLFDAENEVTAIYIYDDFNRAVSTYRHASTPIYNYPEDLFENSSVYNIKPLRKFMNQESNVLLVSSYYNESRQKDIIRFALNIFDQEYPRGQIGCVVCEIDSDVFANILEKYSFGEKNIIWIQPVGDRTIVNAGDIDGEYQEEYERITKDIRMGKDDSKLDLKTDGEVLFHVSNTKYKLEIFSLMPPSQLVQNQQQLTRNLVIIAIILLASCGAAAVILAGGITQPLEYLTDTMRKIRRGDRAVRVKALGNDEIGELGSNFNKMLDDMEQMIAREYKNRLMLQEAEYKALQAQINPHFLYNTLDTMSSIAQIQECDMVSELSEALSAIFRYSLDMKNPMSTIEKEILHLKNYIYVMDVRMHSNIQYKIEIDENMLHLEIPRLTIQPIVENSLKYGVRDIRGEKIICILAREEGDNLLITVKDNGTGMNPNQLNEQFEINDLDYVEKGDSIGLHNINARVKLLFGQKYGVHIYSEPQKGTEVTVKIPNIKEVDTDGEDKI